MPESLAVHLHRLLEDEHVYHLIGDQYHGRHASPTKEKDPSKESSQVFGLIWLILYIPGLCVGFVGLISVVLQSRDNVKLRLITTHFLSMSSAFACLVVFIILGLLAERIRRKSEGYAVEVYDSLKAVLEAEALRDSPQQPANSSDESISSLDSERRSIPEEPEDDLGIPLITITPYLEPTSRQIVGTANILENELTSRFRIQSDIFRSHNRNTLEEEADYFENLDTP